MTPVLDPVWIPVLLAGGALLVKSTMGMLDKTGQLERLPPWLRPQVAAGGAALVGFLSALSVGADAPTAAMGAFSVLGLNQYLHATKRGRQKTPEWKKAKAKR